MKTSLRIKDPGEMMATIEITMTVNQWRVLNKQLSRDWPSWKFGAVISDVVRQAEATFYARAEEEVVEP